MTGSKMAKAGVRQHNQPSDVIPGRNYEGIMTNANPKRQAQEV
nr:MAG TPA: hypothetical protein [Caudoviricetes sp.]